MRLSIPTAVLLVAAASLRAGEEIRRPSAEEIDKIRAALPERPSAEPARPRRLIVIGHEAWHAPVPYAAKAFELMGRKTGAFEAVVTDDGAFLEPERLRDFDAVLVNNWHGFNPFLPVPADELTKLAPERQAELREREAARRRSLLDFVVVGKGLAGIHAATVGLNDWPEYAEMIGGRYQALPWMEALVRVEEPGHPLCAAFERKSFRIADEIYELKEPYSRDKLRVLLSVDPADTGRPKSERYGKPLRTDGDYPLSWVKSYGKGRVFYCALGHFYETYWNPAMLRHFLDGIQFALGDLEAEAAPRPGPQ
jgi:type 1 glutamine amidotransferase